MEDLHIYFDVDQICPQAFAWMHDDYDSLAKLTALENKHRAAPDRFHNALLDLAEDMVEEGYNFVPFAGTLIGHVVAHHQSEAIRKKIQRSLDYVEGFLNSFKRDHNLTCCAFETYFCMARMVNEEKPFAHMVYENYSAITWQTMSLHSEILQEVILAVSHAPQAEATKEIFLNIARNVFESFVDLMDEQAETEDALQKWITMVELAINIGVNISDDRGIVAPLTECFSRAWDNLYQRKHEVAKTLVGHYFSPEILQEHVHPIFHRMMMEKAEKIFGQKPKFGPSYPMVSTSDLFPPGLAPNP